jgi:hypothetical protein
MRQDALESELKKSEAFSAEKSALNMKLEEKLETERALYRDASARELDLQRQLGMIIN